MVDVLLHEYGWDIDYVLDQSIARIRLYLANILERRTEEFRREAKLIEWSTKVISMTMAATTGKDGKELQKSVSKISLDLDGEGKKGNVHPEPGADTYYEGTPGAKESGEGSSVPENPRGSYEAFRQGFRV